MMTPEQKKAATFLWANDSIAALQLVAGAGSGKTTTLIEAVEQCNQSYLPASEITMITFTRKAAHEMQLRLAARNLSVKYCSTMHALAYKHFLKNTSRKYRIIKNSDAIINSIARKLLPQYSHIPAIALLKSSLVAQEEIDKIYSQYHEYKQNNAFIDFEDMITHATSLLQNARDTGFKVVFVDEFQDTSPIQIEFLKAMKPEKLFVVGDDWQSIYKFRGADVNISLNFTDDFNKSKRLFLTENFRSQKHVVKLGNRIIKLSSSFIKKKLNAHHPKQKKPAIYFLPVYDRLTDMVAYFAERLAEITRQYKVTILVRTNYIRKLLENHLNEAVNILTIHSAKGLEFDHVIVFGIAENIMPHRWASYDEEVRLLYVAATRAKHRLDFVAWGGADNYSKFTPLLVKQCRVKYL